MIRSRGLDGEDVGIAVILLIAVTLVVALVLMAAPRPFGPVPTPLFPVMVVYFWSIVRPDLMSAGVVFLSGLALDLLTGTPFGFWALGLLAASGAARMIRPYVLGGAMWRRLAGIAGTVAAASLAGLIALGAAGRPLQPGWLQLVQLILSVLTYPLLEAAVFAIARGVGAGRGRT